MGIGHFHGDGQTIVFNSLTKPRSTDGLCLAGPIFCDGKEPGERFTDRCLDGADLCVVLEGNWGLMLGWRRAVKGGNVPRFEGTAIAKAEK